MKDLTKAFAKAFIGYLVAAAGGALIGYAILALAGCGDNIHPGRPDARLPHVPVQPQDDGLDTNPTEPPPYYVDAAVATPDAHDDCDSDKDEDTDEHGGHH